MNLDQLWLQPEEQCARRNAAFDSSQQTDLQSTEHWCHHAVESHCWALSPIHPKASTEQPFWLPHVHKSKEPTNEPICENVNSDNLKSLERIRRLNRFQSERVGLHYIVQVINTHACHNSSVFKNTYKTYLDNVLLLAQISNVLDVLSLENW